MHRSCVAHEVCACPDMPRKEFEWLQVTFQPIAWGTSRYEVARIMRTASRERDDMIERRGALIERNGAVHTALPAITQRHLSHGTFQRCVRQHAACVLSRDQRALEHAAAARAHGGAFGRPSPSRRGHTGHTAFREPQIASGHHVTLGASATVDRIATNDDAPTEAKSLTSGRMAMSKDSARSAVGRIPRSRTEGVGWHRRWRRRTRAGVGATQRRRELPRVERIILQVRLGGEGAAYRRTSLQFDIVNPVQRYDGRRPREDTVVMTGPSRADL